MVDSSYDKKNKIMTIREGLISNMELLVGDKLQKKIRSLQKKAIRAVNNSTFKTQSNPLFSKLKVLNLDDSYKLCVLTFMHGYFNDNLPSSFQNMFNSLVEPNRTNHIN